MIIIGDMFAKFVNFRRFRVHKARRGTKRTPIEDSGKGSPEPPEVVENGVPAPGARCCDGLQADSPSPSIPAVGPRTVATMPVRA